MVKLIVRIVSIIFWMLLIMLFIVVLPRTTSFFEQKSLNIFTWSYIIDEKYVRKFEKETGIKVNLSYYESNEELLGKLLSSNSSYDLIVPSDYAINIMIEKGMLQEIDPSRLVFFDRLDKKIMDTYADPHNKYSIPYFWGIYGIIINKEYYPATVPHSFDLVFDQAYIPHFICMPGNAREVIMMAAQYLFGDINVLLDPIKRNQVKDLLIKQKKWVSCYSDERPEYVIMSRTCSAVLALSPDASRIRRFYKGIDFIVPTEASFTVIDSFVIPKNTCKQEYIYKFLNYFYTDEVIVHHCSKLGSCPVVQLKNPENEQGLCLVGKSSDKIIFFNSQISNDIFNEIWMELMAA